MDFITGLPKVQGKDCIYVVVDRLTKYAHFFPITFDFKASQVAELFLRNFLGYMACLGTSSVTETIDSLALSGRSSFI